MYTVLCGTCTQFIMICMNGITCTPGIPWSRANRAMGVSLEVYRAAIGHHYFQSLFRHAGVNHVNDRHAPNQSPCGRLQIKDHRQSSIGRYVAPILLCVTITLLLLSGDVEINPGPQCPNCKAETVGTIMNRGSPQRMSFPPSCIHCKRDFRGVTVQVRELAWEMR